MDLETAIQAFARAGHDLPREAMQWTLDHWEEVAPDLLGMLERLVSGADRSDETTSAAFFILPLAGEKQDRRVFPLLCRLALDGEALEAVLGDGVTTHQFSFWVFGAWVGKIEALVSRAGAVEA